MEKYCPECDHVFFDAPSPAVIIALTNADRILLTKKISGVHSYWGLVSGHVKQGETAEEAAIREVREETGLEIFNLTILRTYMMKANNLLMIGFSAKTNSSIVSQSKELAETTWFKMHDQLPMRPHSISLQIVEKIRYSQDTASGVSDR